ncbi:MAG TPA: hypothetical protein VL981_09045 [Candidatus Methylacidiphilales bacterium]|nr:hypothetical protein [Candidatus Methylacidiphilales bacterium]
MAQTLRNLIGPLILIHEKAGPRLLRFVRFGVALLWIVKLLLDPLWRLGELPHDLLQLTGFLAFFPRPVIDQLFSPSGLTTLYAITLISLLLCLTNRAYPLAATVACFFITAYSCVIRSFGPPVHTDIVLILACYALAAYGWADFIAARFQPDRVSPATWSSYPLVTIICFLTLSYMLVGFNRMETGGIRVFTGDTMETWAVDASLRGYYFNTNIGWHVPEWPLAVLFLRLGLPVITLFEMTAPLCLVSSHYRWLFIPTMLSFHLLSLVFMNIFFFDDMFLYLLLIDWSRRFPALSGQPDTAA